MLLKVVDVGYVRNSSSIPQPDTPEAPRTSAVVIVPFVGMLRL